MAKKPGCICKPYVSPDTNAKMRGCHAAYCKCPVHHWR